jgi:hypothetical protein
MLHTAHAQVIRLQAVQQVKSMGKLVGNIYCTSAPVRLYFLFSLYIAHCACAGDLAAGRAAVE